MLDRNKFERNEPIGLSQIEINTFACGGCATPALLTKLHKYSFTCDFKNEVLN